MHLLGLAALLVVPAGLARAADGAGASAVPVASSASAEPFTTPAGDQVQLEVGGRSGLAGAAVSLWRSRVTETGDVRVEVQEEVADAPLATYDYDPSEWTAHATGRVPTRKTRLVFVRRGGDWVLDEEAVTDSFATVDVSWQADGPAAAEPVVSVSPPGVGYGGVRPPRASLGLRRAAIAAGSVTFERSGTPLVVDLGGRPGSMSHRVP